MPLVLTAAPAAARRRTCARLVAAAALVALGRAAAAQQPAATDWPAYGRDPGGSRYAPIAQVDRANVAQLQVAWTFNTGETESGGRSFAATPILVDGTLYLSTPLGKSTTTRAVSGLGE